MPYHAKTVTKIASFVESFMKNRYFWVPQKVSLDKRQDVELFVIKLTA